MTTYYAKHVDLYPSQTSQPVRICVDVDSGEAFAQYIPGDSSQWLTGHLCTAPSSQEVGDLVDAIVAELNITCAETAEEILAVVDRYCESWSGTSIQQPLAIS